MINKHFKELPNEVIQSFNEIEKQGLDIDRTSQYAVAGQIVIELLVSQSTFMQITQNKDVFKQVKKAVLTLKTDLIKKMLAYMYSDQTIWNNNKYTLQEKIQISYQIIGYEYLKGNYDSMYSIFSKVLMSIFSKVQLRIGRNIQPKTFKIGNDDYIGIDEELVNISQRLNITYSLLFFSLRSRSQLGLKVWEKAGVPLPSFLNPNELSRQKRLMFNIGEIVVLLTAYEFCYNSGILNSIDITGINTVNIDSNRSDFLSQLHKVLQTKKLAIHLFESLALNNPGRLSENDKCQVFENVAFSFFISNFNPGKVFQEVFSKDIADYYKNGLENSIDYRYSVLSLMRKLEIDIKYNGKQDDDVFYFRIVIDNRFEFTNKGNFKSDVKTEIWKKAYLNTVESLQNFLCGKKTIYSIELLQLLISKISNLSVSMLRSIGKNMYLLNIQSISRIGIDEYQRIVVMVRDFLSDLEIWNKLKKSLILLNKDYYICFESQIFKYSDALAIFEGQKNINKLQPIHINRVNCISIYQGLVNPTEIIQKKMIDIDYRIVKYINPISFTVAKYAIDNSLDAFNQIILPNQQVKEYYQKILADIEEEEKNMGVLISDTSQGKVIMFDSNRLLSEQLYELIANMEIRKAVFACGYCFKSGLTLLDKIISKTVYNNVPVQFVVGSLQKYRSCLDGESTITGIDKATVKLLNQYLDEENVQLYTCENRFYHGKIYAFESDKETVICIGSSNISRSAYASNYELNIGFIIPNNSELKNNFDLLIKRIIKCSVIIDHLDESVFCDNEINMEGSSIIRKLSLDSVQKRINELTNEEVKYRLNLWMSYSPSIAMEDIGVKALPNYFMFVYPERKLIVLESFSAGNSYFCLRYSDSFESEINKISTLSKTEIFQYSHMSKRGYHTSNKFTLESNIRRYFR